MVSSNPLWSGHSGILRKFQATVINDIWPEVTLFSLVATMVCLVTEKTSHSLAIQSSLLTVLGTVLGLVISFRTSTAYERYQEGRKLWTTLALASRNLGHMIWNHVDYVRDEKHHPSPTDAIPAPNAKIAAIIEKKSMLNLVHAFAVSVKHLLRGEPGIYYEDLFPLVSFLPRYSAAIPTEADMLPLWKASDLYAVPGTTTATRAHTRAGTPAPFTTSPPNEAVGPELPRQGAPSQITESDFTKGDDRRQASWLSGSGAGSRKKKTFDPEKVLPQVESDRPLLPARNPPRTTLYNYLPFLRVFKPIIKLFTRKDSSLNEDGRRSLLGHKKYLAHVESNVPLEISLFLSSYLAWLLKKGLLTPALATAITNNISILQDCAGNLQRIRNTPLPFAYQAHLRMSLWLYLFFLPFQIQKAMGWLTIPATAFASFLLLGFLEIGQEIENPFNYDLNDLDLDGFCLQIQRELAEITAHPVATPDSFLFTSQNQPFAPADRRTAEEILRDVAHEYHGAERGMDSIRRTLLKSWRDVDAQTREHYSGWSAQGQ